MKGRLLYYSNVMTLTLAIDAFTVLYIHSFIFTDIYRYPPRLHPELTPMGQIPVGGFCTSFLEKVLVWLCDFGFPSVSYLQDSDIIQILRL